MSSVIKSPFINLASNSKKLIKVDSNDPNIINNRIHNVTEAREEIKVTSINDKNNQLIAQAREIADSIINKARLEADNIINNAQTNAIQIEREAYEKASEEGFNEGLKQGQVEAESIKNKANFILEEAREEKQRMLNEIEPKMVEIMVEMIRKITGVIIDNEAIIIYLIKKGFSEIEAYENIIIHISVDDYDYVNSNKEKLYENMSEKVSIEILKDTKLEKNQCIIETDVGNIDCSLDIRLESLLSELNLIANSLKSNKG